MGAHILRQLREFIYPGEGFLRVKEIPLQNVHLASDGSLLTTTLDTNPGWDKAGTNMTVLSWAAGIVVAAGLTIQIPDDYDETEDHLKLKLKAASAGTTDSPTITAAAYKDSDPTTDLAPDATAAADDEAAWLEVDLSGNSLVAGDVVQLSLTPGAHDNDALNVYAIKAEYRSSLVYNDQTQPR